jgi:hypothetical protein
VKRRSVGVERFLDEAAVNDLKNLRIIHGLRYRQLGRSIAGIPARPSVRVERSARAGSSGRRRRHRSSN